MGFGGLFGSSPKHAPPSWTSGSFPGAAAVQYTTTSTYPSYTYSSYAPQPVWQAQPLMAVPQYPVQVPVQMQVPMQVPVMQVPTAQMVYSPQAAPTYAVVQQQQQQTTVTAPSTNALLLHQGTVPSPVISHVIPCSPRRSPRAHPPSPPEHQHMCVVQEQTVQSPQVAWQQQQQPQGQQPGQGHPSPMNLSISLSINGTPMHSQILLPGNTPGPAPPQALPPTGPPPRVIVEDVDDTSSGEEEDTDDDDEDDDHHDPNPRNPNPSPGPNNPPQPDTRNSNPSPRPRTPRHGRSNIIIFSPRPMLSTLITPTPLPQFPSPIFQCQGGAAF